MQCLYDTGSFEKPANTPIWLAVRENYLWSVQWLLAMAHLDVSARDDQGHTLFEWVVPDGEPEMVDCPSSSPKIDSNTKKKTTARHLCIRQLFEVTTS